MIITKYKNGNFRVRKEDYDDENLIVALCNSAELDFDFAGDEFCLGNATGMAYDLYNANTGLTYCVTSEDINKWKYMYSVLLRGRKEDRDEN